MNDGYNSPRIGGDIWQKQRQQNRQSRNQQLKKARKRLPKVASNFFPINDKGREI